MSVQSAKSEYTGGVSLAERQVTVRRKTAGEIIYRCGKRCFDFLAALVGSVLLFLPMCLIALVIMINDPGNPFYVQERVGQHGKMIRVIKFRSMKKNADDLEKMLTPEELVRYQEEYKLDQDPRLLGYKPGMKGNCLGELLRKGSIDELPQFWNILWGNMSFVGPRPILPRELEDNYSPEEQRELLSVKPGLSGHWQVSARNNATYATGERQELELYYVRNAGVKLDLKILFATFGVVISGEGAK